MIFGFLGNMENTIAIYFYSTPGLGPFSHKNDALPLNSLFWSPPTAVHRSDASDMTVPGLYISWVKITFLQMFAVRLYCLQIFAVRIQDRGKYVKTILYAGWGEYNSISHILCCSCRNFFKRIRNLKKIYYFFYCITYRELTSKDDISETAVQTLQTVSLYSIHGFLHRVIKRGGEA